MEEFVIGAVFLDFDLAFFKLVDFLINLGERRRIPRAEKKSAGNVGDAF